MVNTQDSKNEIDFLQVSFSKLSKSQRLIWNAMLITATDWHTCNSNEDKESYEITFESLCSKIGLAPCTSSHLKKIILPLCKISLHVGKELDAGKTSFQSFPLIPSVEFGKDKIIFTIAEPIKTKLKEPGAFVPLDLAVESKFKLETSAVLYQWLCRFKDSSTKKSDGLAWTELRWMLIGPIEDTSIYQQYKEFKRAKLKPAIAEINECSEMNVELVLETGPNKEATNLHFIFKEKAA